MNSREIIDKINNLDKPKYYVSCGVPIIAENLWKKGIPIYINLLANNQMNAVPNLKMGNDGNVSSNVKFSGLLKYTPVMEQLGIKKEYGNFDNFNDGIYYIKQQVENKKFANVGVSSYFIPYSRDYLSQDYIKNYTSRTIGITNHYIMILDIKDDKLKVLDTTPVYQYQSLSVNDFCKAWASDRSIPNLRIIKGIEKIRPYTYFEVKTQACITSDQIFDISKKTFKNIIIEYLAGREKQTQNFVIFYGIKSIEKLISYILDKLSSDKVLNVNQIIQCTTEMRISRFFLIDIYSDMCMLFPYYAVFKIDFEAFYFKLNASLMRLIIELTKNKKDLKKINQSLFNLKELVKEEKDLLRRILEVR